MEGRGLSDLYRNTSEEIFLRSYMESSMGISVPPSTTTAMDVLGFRNLSHSFRTDSEELFKSWLSNGENNGINSPSLAHRTRQASRRILSTELGNSNSQQNSAMPQNKRINDNSVPQSCNVEADDIVTDINHHHSVRNVIEKGLPELYLAKAWFHSPQPMTRNRSSELRKRFVAMQSGQTTQPTGFEALLNVSKNDTNPTSHDFGYHSHGTFNVPPPVFEMSVQMDAFVSPSNSSSSTLNPGSLILAEPDKVSSVVSMLKGTLERKKPAAHVEKEVLEDESSNGVLFPPPDFVLNGDQIFETPLASFRQELLPVQVKDPLEGFVSSLNPNPIQSSRVSQEQSQSESSGVTPVISSGFDALDGPSNSSQAAISASENGSRKNSRNRNSENSSKAKDIRDRVIGSLKEDRKKASLQRHGSVTSAILGDHKEDSTKKRRVERSRKMAEAKERNLTPIIPTDMQSVLKRYETLEKEVRSLKLNLSFMNRKDSEQTKQIEELQKQNEELQEEKECLVEEINKIITDTRKI